MQPRIFPAAPADAALEDHKNQARRPDDDLKPARKLVRHRDVMSNKKPAIRGRVIRTNPADELLGRQALQKSIIAPYWK
jgi:hypothetical protein